MTVRLKPRIVVLPYVLLLLFVAAATSLGGFWFPWWWPAVPGLLAGFWRRETPVRIFLVSFLGAGAAWAVVAIGYDTRNEGILSARIAPLFHLGGSLGLVLATAIVGGVTAGLGALVGDHFHRFWRSLMLALAAEDIVIPPDEEKA
jgi:hypothetical protein